MSRRRLLLPSLLLPLLCLSCASAHRATSQPQPAADSGLPDEESLPRGDVVPEELCVPIPPRSTASWYHQAVGYEIFVRSFYDSDGDGIGDLRGILEKLDYINDGDPESLTDLGATLLWLMPTFPSPSYHGYDVTDYRGVHPEYGTAEDLKALLAACEERGIRVLLDLVLNHSSSEHPWFAESRTPGSAYRDWYVWSESPREWHRPWGGKASTWHEAEGGGYYYGIFWGGMPDLNYTNEAVRNEMVDVARYWLDEFGIAGFRLDAVRYIVETGPDGLQDTPETMAWWKEFAGAIAESHPDALLLGEAWASNQVAAQYHAGGQGLQLTFDFDLMESVVAGLLAEEPADIERVLCRFAPTFPEGAGDATFLSNHDLVRLASRLKERPELYRLAAELLFTLPGLPMVYYGQEIGMTNGPTLADEHKRLPMQWDATPQAGFTAGTPWKAVNGNHATVNVAAQTADGTSLLSLYRTLIRLRQGHPALATGGFVPLPATSKTAYDVWGFSRHDGSERLAVFVNFGEATALDARLTLPQGVYAGATRHYPASTVPAEVNGTTLQVGDVPPYSLTIVAVQ